MKHPEHVRLSIVYAMSSLSIFNRETFRKDLTLFDVVYNSFLQKADFLDFDFHVKFGLHD